jgi:hypothetical protein
MQANGAREPARAALEIAAPVLGASVPQQINTSGNCYLDLRLDGNDFIATAAATATEDRS